MKIMDCTLRDGANVVGKGFDAHLTQLTIEGLIRCGITTIEMGNCLGLGAYEANKSIAPLTDREYLELIQPYLDKAEIGMFIGWRNCSQENVDLAVRYGLKFLRIGANAGDGSNACDAIQRVKNAGLTCRYSIMKAYLLAPEEEAREAKMLAACGLDEITVMDSAGTMLPEEVAAYCRALSQAIDIPVAFHGHNNLGLSVANALAAQESGATVFDTGLLGMARSAGNCATELLVAALQRKGWLKEIDLYGLLDFLDGELIPAMREISTYHPPVMPNDLVYGLAGCHSSFSRMLEAVAKEKKVPLYKLIMKVSERDRKAPSKDLMEEVADTLGV